MLTKIVFALALLASCSAQKQQGRVVEAGGSEVTVISSADDRSAFSLEKNEDLAQTVMSPKGLSSNKAVKKDLSGDDFAQAAQLKLVGGDVDAAIVYAKRSLRLEQKNVLARKVLAQAAVRQNNPDLAELYLIPLSAQMTKDGQLQNLLGLIALQKGMYAQAVRSFKEASRLSPSDTAVRLNLGVLYLRYRQFAQAGLEFEKVLKIDPNNADARIHLAVVQSSRGDFTGALTRLDGVLDQDKNNQLALFNRAMVYRQQKKLDPALEDLSRLVAKAPARTRDVEEAIRVAQEIFNEKEALGQKADDKDFRELVSELDKRSAKKNIAANKVQKSDEPESKEAKPAKKSAAEAKPPQKPKATEDAPVRSKDEEKDYLEKMIR